MHDDAPAGARYADLPFGEQLLVWALRLWVRGYMTQDSGDAEDLPAALRRGFHQANLDAGYSLLDELLSIVSVSARARIDVGCPCCVGIGDDEQLFIAVIAALQRDDFPTGRRLLGYWLTASGVRLALAPALRLARLLTRRGLALRPRTILRPAEEREAAAAPRLPTVDPAPGTLH